MKISLIIPIYKKVDFIETTLETINNQTFRDFEVIVTEDDNTLGEFIDNIKKNLNYPLIHIQQEDEGYQRNKALNNALKVASGDLIVVIDQDCMIHPKFLEAYAKSYNKGDLLTGRRVNLGKKFTEKIIKKKIRKISIFSLLFSDTSSKKYLDALYLPWLNIKRSKRILGSNFGIKKELLIKINGFNEDYVGYGWEDVDLEKRCIFAGAKLFSMKNKAIQYHLYHLEPQGSTLQYQKNIEILGKVCEKKLYRCENGLEK